MLYVLGSIVGLILILYLLVQIPWFQTQMAKYAARYLSRELNTEVRIDELEILGFKKVGLEGLILYDRRDDTLAFIGSLDVKLSKLKTEGPQLSFRYVDIVSAGLYLKKYEGDTVSNLHFFLEYLSAGEKDTTGPGFKLSAGEVTATQLSFRYRDMNAEKKEGIDFKNLDLTGIGFKAADLSIEGDDIRANMQNLSARDHSGFHIREFSGDLLVMSDSIDARDLIIRTNKSDIGMDLAFDFTSFRSFGNFIDSVRMIAELSDSEVNMSDIGFFAPSLSNMDKGIAVAGRIRGKVSDLKASPFRFSYGRETSFEGSISLDGLPEIEETFVHLSINQMTTSMEDVQTIRLPGNGQYISLPAPVEKFGRVELTGKFTGFYNDFVSYGDFDTELGDLSTDIMLKLNKKEEFIYNGKLNADGFDIGAIANAGDVLGKMDLQMKLNGKGLSAETADIEMEGVVDSLVFYDNLYNSIQLSGNFENQSFAGNVSMDDKKIRLNFSGMLDFGHAVPRYNFTAGIEDANLAALNLVDADSAVMFSTKLAINAIGSDLDELQGIIRADSTILSANGKEIFMKELNLSVTGEPSGYRFITLRSDYLDASLEGEIVFRDIYPSFLRTVNVYLDTLIADTVGTVARQDFNFELNFKNTDDLSDMFLPDIALSEKARIKGSYHSFNNNLQITGRSDSLAYKGYRLRGWDFKVASDRDDLSIRLAGNHLYLSDTLNIDSLVITAGMDNDSILFALNWRSPAMTAQKQADIRGYIDFVDANTLKAKLRKAQMYFNDEQWNLNKDNYIVIDSSSVFISNFDFKSKDERISLAGKMSMDARDTLHISFDNFDVSNLDVFLNNLGIDFDGVVSGDTKLTGLYGTPNMVSDMGISDFTFNGEKLGDLKLISKWNDQESAADILAEIIYTGNIGQKKILEVGGKYRPAGNKDNFDITVTLNGYKLRTLEPFLSSFSSRLGGLASGEIRMTGSQSSPEFSGKINLVHAQMEVDYLNVIYYFADEIEFDKDRLIFDQLVLNDSLNNQATLSGSVDFNGFKNIALDIQIDAQHLACLNTTRGMNDMFYGQAFATGDISIKGPVDNLSMDIAVETGNGTSVVIPISYAVDVTEHNYIIFIDENGKQTDKSPEAGYRPDVRGLEMNFDLTVNPQAEVEIILPYQMGRIKSQGQGKIDMNVTEAGDFRMFGDYDIRRGSFFFTLQNIINRQFDIQRGGSIKWTGDPVDARIDVKAAYRLKTTIAGFSTGADSATRVLVDAIIHLKNKLVDPEFDFNVQFPNLTDEAKQIIYARLDTNDQAEMNQQMVSLLVMNSFYFGNTYSSGVGFNTFSILSNQINNWLSGISKDFDIGINYIAGGELTQDEVEVALSTQLFNDRVSIDSNVGVRGDNENAPTRNANNIVGEVTVEVRITEDGRFRVKAFNRANNAFLSRNYSPYTQGVGVFYTQEFNKLSELFSKRKRLTRED